MELNSIVSLQAEQSSPLPIRAFLLDRYGPHSSRLNNWINNRENKICSVLNMHSLAEKRVPAYRINPIFRKQQVLLEVFIIDRNHLRIKKIHGGI